MNRKVLGLLALIVIPLSVAACSSSSNHASTTPTSSAGQSTATSAVAQASGAPMKVGVICSCSGPFGSALVATEDVYKAWANAANASGGIQGHPVQLITMDDGAVPGTSTTDMQALISDHVVAIADMSEVDQVWASAVQAANIPVVGMQTTNTPFYTNADFYPEGQTGDSSIYAGVATAKAAGATSLGFIYCAEAPSCADAFSLGKAAGQKLGVSVPFGTAASGTAPNYTAQCVAAKQDHLGALFLNLGQAQDVRVGTDCAQQGYNPIYVVQGPVYNDALFTTAPGIKNNLWSAFSVLPYSVNTPAVAQMTAAVNKYYPGLIDNTTAWAENSALSWVAGLLLADAVKAGGLGSTDTPTASEVVKGLESLNGDTLDGWSPPLSFASGKPHSIDCWFTLHVQDGASSLTNGGKTTCESGMSS
jgi:branched-chain amino acid transport system substrate-binding protein